MIGIGKKWTNNIFKQSPGDGQLSQSLRRMIGWRPGNLQLYKLALRHSSVARENEKGIKESNERLEYLGDAVLGMIVAEYLFCKFPYKSEGFLTEIRSRIVNRESMNAVSKKIGLSHLIEYDSSSRNTIKPKSLYGDTLEALIGAVFLDKGYKSCKTFVVKKLLSPNFDIDEIVSNNPNYKSRIIEWAQKENRELKFEIVDIEEVNHLKKFTAQVMLEDEPIGTGYGLSKKKAEQDAAQKSLDLLKID